MNLDEKAEALAEDALKDSLKRIKKGLSWKQVVKLLRDRAQMIEDVIGVEKWVQDGEETKEDGQ